MQTDNNNQNQDQTDGSGWGILHLLRLLLRLPFLVLHLFIGLPLIFMTYNRMGRAISIGDRSLDEVMQSWWTLNFCRIFGIRRKVFGQILKQPYFVVANHVSFMDIVLLGSIRKMSFVSKAEIANWPLVGFIAKKADTVFHQRGSGSSLQAVVDAISLKIKENKSVAIFPEGRIYCGDKVHRFHARLFQVPIELNVEVLPVCIRYVRKGQPPGQLNPRITLCHKDERFFWNLIRLLGEPGSEVELHIQPVLSPKDKSRRELAEAAQASVAALYFSKADQHAS